MDSSKERRSGGDRRQASMIKRFPILDSAGTFIEADRRAYVERRTDPRTTLQFIKANEFLARLADLDD